MPRTCIINSPYVAKFKVGVVGCGNVGATAAYAMLIEGTPSEIVLYDLDYKRAHGLELDFEHSLSFVDYTKITSTKELDGLHDCDMIVITAGARQKKGETRLDLITKNREIFKQIIPKIAKVAPNSILVIVSNPVDVLTYEAIKLSRFPEHRVFGTGTMLDTARFQFHISEKLCISPKSIDAYVLGEHGDTSFPVYSSANVAGKPIMDFEGFDQKAADETYQKTKDAAYRIIHDMGFTCYSIGMVIKEIMVHITHNSRVALPLSVMLHDYYDHSDVCLSVPCILDSEGIAEVITVPLDEKEQEMLAKSVETLKGYQ